MSLEGKTALVTGGTRGIGLAITRSLHEAGASVVAVGRSQERIDQLKAVLGDGARVAGRVCDVRDRAALEGLRESLDSLDILVPNAGVTTRMEAVDLGDAGEALEAAAGLDVSSLSAERQARLHLDIARAHAQRHHVGEALKALLTAEQLSPEQVHGHAPARETILDLLGLSGRRPSEELQELARRAGAIP